MDNREMEAIKDRRREEHHSSTKDFMLGAIIGGIVGAATAIFLTPNSSKEIRHTLLDLKNVTISKGNELLTLAQEKTTSVTKSMNHSKEILNKDSDFREKEEQTNETKYVPIEPFISSQEELQKKLKEAQIAIEEQEQRIKG